MELGLCTFVELTADPLTGQKISPEQRMKNLMEEIELAEQVGLEVFAIGEHHRPDFLVSSPAVVLGAAAARTKKLRLSTAVTVLSSDDPVRVFQDFATIDLLSGGRAEIMAGRGSFIESFPLFGYELKDYDELFSEKLGLLIALNENEKITWRGKFRPPIHNLGVYPRPVQDKIPIWIAVGGTPESVIRAGTLGLHLMIAIIGGMSAQFVPLVELYRQSALKAGQHLSGLKVGINHHTFIAEDSRQAADVFYPSYAAVMSRIGRERGWPAMNRMHYEQMRAFKGSLFIGSPSEITERILYEHELFGHSRFLAQMSVGTVPHDKMMKSIELFGNVVAPAVRKALNT